MYMGNVMLLILNLPLVGVFAKLTNTPANILMPLVTALMLVGAFSVNNSMMDVILTLVFGLAGFALKYLNIPAAPLVIGLVLGSICEEGLRQGLIMCDGNFLGFFTRPISGTILGLSVILCLFMIFKQVAAKKKVLASN